MISIRGQKIREARTIQRNQLFPDSNSKVWTLDRAGYNPIPRVLPLMGHLFGDKEHGNPTRVYFELWCRCYDVGFAEIRSEEEAAYASGYDGQRAVRTWRGHIEKLRQLGFIEVTARGNLKYGFILLVDPFKVIARLSNKKQITDYWFNAFHARCLEVGTQLPQELTDEIERRTKAKANKRSAIG